MSIIEKSVQVAEEEKTERKVSKSGMKLRQKPPVNRSPPLAEWTSNIANKLLGESATDPVFISQFKNLKRAIIQSAFGPLAVPNANLIVITSAQPNAGKTFISMNLAQTLAQERDRKVLLIDTDNIKASLTSALGLRDNDGFFDVLDKPDLSLEDVIIPTEVPSLEVVPTGTHYPDSAELLNSRRAKDLLTRLARSDTDRLIIFDAPPLLATSDTPALTDLVGQFLLVVEAGGTKQNELSTALEILGDDKTVGLILNKASRAANSLYRGYYHASQANKDG